MGESGDGASGDEGRTENGLGNGEGRAIVVVEGDGEVACELEVLDLVSTDWDMCCAVNEYMVSLSVISHLDLDL